MEGMSEEFSRDIDQGPSLPFAFSEKRVNYGDLQGWNNQMFTHFTERWRNVTPKSRWRVPGQICGSSYVQGWRFFGQPPPGAGKEIKRSKINLTESLWTSHQAWECKRNPLYQDIQKIIKGGNCHLAQGKKSTLLRDWAIQNQLYWVIVEAASAPASMKT